MSQAAFCELLQFVGFLLALTGFQQSLLPDGLPSHLKLLNESGAFHPQLFRLCFEARRWICWILKFLPCDLPRNRVEFGDLEERPSSGP